VDPRCDRNRGWVFKGRAGLYPPKAGVARFVSPHPVWKSPGPHSFSRFLFLFYRWVRKAADQQPGYAPLKVA
jgi:hypothetical protein